MHDDAGIQAGELRAIRDELERLNSRGFRVWDARDQARFAQLTERECALRRSLAETRH